LTCTTLVDKLQLPDKHRHPALFIIPTLAVRGNPTSPFSPSHPLLPIVQPGLSWRFRRCSLGACCTCCGPHTPPPHSAPRRGLAWMAAGCGTTATRRRTDCSRMVLRGRAPHSMPPRWGTARMHTGTCLRVLPPVRVAGRRREPSWLAGLARRTTRWTGRGDWFDGGGGGGRRRLLVVVRTASQQQPAPTSPPPLSRPTTRIHSKYSIDTWGGGPRRVPRGRNSHHRHT